MDSKKETRALCYRFLRHVISDDKALKLLLRLSFEIFISRSIIKDQSADVEREQALRLIHSWLDIKDGVFWIPKSIICCLVSVLEQTDDKMRFYCALIVSELGKSFN